jgi:hypothetical protein
MKPLVIVLLIPLMGCVYHARPGDLAVSRATIPLSERNVAWQHAITALLDNGYVPQVLNEAAGYIGARRRDDLDNGPLVGSLATVVFTPEGVVRVEVSGVGIGTSEKAFLDAIATRQNDIMAGILATHAAHPLTPPPPAEPTR